MARHPQNMIGPALLLTPGIAHEEACFPIKSLVLGTKSCLETDYLGVLVKSD